ncbi:NUDIX hydrolase [Candidatus Micrarchaeota archaeon]|nr:NUDIX hydrolase [Candidatus Micrarchaeota archaeon]
MRRRVPTFTAVPKALAVGALEDGNRYLFLIRRDHMGFERLELPCILVPSGRSPFAEISSEFVRQTGIDAQVHEPIYESRYNVGTKRRKAFVPVLVFKITARERFAKPAPEFAGFKWLTLDDAKREKLTKNCEWLIRPAPPPYVKK